MTRYTDHMQATPQSEPEDPRQVMNNAGGYTFTVDKWRRLERFLVLGAEGGTYYVNERKLTRDNARVVGECLDEDPARAVGLIVEVSDKGRAPKNDPAVFALALAAAHSSDEARRHALAALPKVCRIGTHLFQFVASARSLGRGWGRGLKTAVARWYLDKPNDRAAYQALKYQQREGWSHRDLLRLAKPTPDTPEQNALFRWIAKGELIDGHVAMLAGYEQLKVATHAEDVAALVRLYGFTHEMVPTAHKNDVSVWEALLERMPMTAMIRNLGKMTSIGLLKAGSDGARAVVGKLSAPEAIRKARVHPITMLSALRIYARGQGLRGSLTWRAVPSIIDALDEAFYLAFENIQPTGKRIMVGLDVSGSMGIDVGTIGLTAREVSAAMAMATVRTESDVYVFGFTGGGMYSRQQAVTHLPITKKQRLDDVVAMISNLPFGPTDCSLPMRGALQQQMEFDAFVVYTDNETWSGPMHPHEALKLYRRKLGIPAKLAVCATTSSGFSIADPNDPGMLDVVGFSANCPAVLADFIRRE
ncbi:MAG: TROVE domain-containing protein [Candidatus Deferrimicrobiaceae bacterium]